MSPTGRARPPCIGLVFTSVYMENSSLTSRAQPQPARPRFQAKFTMAVNSAVNKKKLLLVFTVALHISLVLLMIFSTIYSAVALENERSEQEPSTSVTAST